MKKLLLLFFICSCLIGIAQESFTLSPESVLTIAGTSTMHDWEVTATSFEGSITTTGEIIDNLTIEVPVAEIKSERGPTMDNKMYAALKAEEHPIIYFSLTEFKEHGTLTGMLSLAGVEKEIEITAKFVQDNGKVRVSGAEEILLKDYDMEPPTAMFGQIVVGERVTVSFDIHFVKN